MTGFFFDLEPGDVPVGRIRIGDFTETFGLDCSHWTSSDYRANWRAALQRLLSDDPASVALMTERSFDAGDPLQRGWVLFREGDQVFVQERLFVPGQPVRFDDAGLMVDISPREAVSTNGTPISKWETTVIAVEAFARLA